MSSTGGAGRVPRGLTPRRFTVAVSSISTFRLDFTDDVDVEAANTARQAIVAAPETDGVYARSVISTIDPNNSC
jgi:hypothetical protein